MSNITSNTVKKQKTAFAWKTACRLVRDLKPIAWAIALSGIVCVCSVALVSIAPEIVSIMTDIIYDFGETGVPIDMLRMGKLALYLALAYAGGSLLEMAMTVLMTNISSRFYTKGLRIRISAKISRLPVSFVDNTPNGEILSRMMNDVSNMSTTVYVIIETLMNGLVKIVVIAVLMYLTNWILATAVIVLVPLSIALSAFISSKSEQSWHDFRKINGKMYSFIEEDYTGFDTVKAFNLEDRQRLICDDISAEYRGKVKRAYYLSGLVQPIIALTNNIAYVAVCIAGGVLAVNGTVSVGDVIKIVLFAKMFAGPLESIANGMGSIQHTLACANRVYQLLDREEMSVAQTDDVPEGAGEVEFSHVCFSYTPDKPLIKDLNLKVKAGQKVALVGPTGGGKTTIVNLLMRFYDIDSGRITVDGVDTSTMDRAKLREQFGMVLQDTWLFNGTVYDNIAYGKENATFDEVVEAAKKARADFFIQTLPDGYNTVINEESTNISSGQKQLLTIARSYLANRKMLILDEATSNVDTRTEILIQKAMDELLKGRTSFVIAHRLSTIVNADVILVVNNGEVVEQGTHAELMSKNGFYTKIYNSQYELLK
ncbi:MAG: ABC transporter ATP-binding protein/permease [Corallococcus sp.]|nr:ABC transporter ATP-binding protein/permease [Corallococcus sp.]MCM1359039.1 ABC transporter ATP-binding protein/permease [Corallococcus sp.]MCM1395028.1 ABC transporter ATP-binding protein/permease [Corallococcus sp.]